MANLLETVGYFTIHYQHIVNIALLLKWAAKYFMQEVYYCTERQKYCTERRLVERNDQLYSCRHARQSYGFTYNTCRRLITHLAIQLTIKH